MGNDASKDRSTLSDEKGNPKDYAKDHAKDHAKDYTKDYPKDTPTDHRGSREKHSEPQYFPPARTHEGYVPTKPETWFPPAMTR